MARREREGPRGHVDGWALQETAGLLLGGQQRPDFALQRFVVHAGLAQERVALVGRTRQRRVQQAIDLFPSFSVHRGSRPPVRDRARPWRYPVAHHGGGRDLEHVGGLVHVESAEEAHLDDLRFARIELRQRVHRVIERDQVRGPVAPHQGGLVQRDMRHATSAFEIVAPRVLHQNAPHHLRRHREEMGAILPLHALIAHEAHVRLIHQRRRLQAMAGTLAPHVAARQPVELVIHDRGQPFERTRVSVAPRAEQLAHLVLGRPPGCAVLCIWQELNCTAAVIVLGRILRLLRWEGKVRNASGDRRDRIQDTDWRKR